MEISATLSQASAQLLERAAGNAENIGKRCASVIGLQPDETALLDAEKTNIIEGIDELHHRMREVFTNTEIRLWMHRKDRVDLDIAVRAFPKIVEQFDKPDFSSSKYPEPFCTARSNARLCALLIQATRWSVRHNNNARSRPIEHRLHIDHPRKPVHIRWMINKDLRAVLEMDEESYAEPWLEQDFMLNLRAHQCMGMVAESDDQVIGSLVYELREHVIPVLRCTVKREERQQGVGSQMVHFLRMKLSSYRRQRLLIELPEEQSGTILNFASHQRFLAVALMRERLDGMQDTLLFEHSFLPLDSSPGYPESNLIAHAA